MEIYRFSATWTGSYSWQPTSQIEKSKCEFLLSIFFYLFMFTCSFILLLLPLQSALWIWMSAFDGEQSKLPIGSSANWRKSNKLSAVEISNNPEIRKTDKTSLFASSIASDIAYNIVDPLGNRLEPQISRLLKMIPYNHKRGCWFGCRARGKMVEFPKNSTKRNIWRAGAYMAQYRNIPVWNSITTNAAGKVLLFGKGEWTQDLQKRM